MIDPHFHCGECGIAIAAATRADDGTPVAALIRAGQQAFVQPAPEGIAIGMRQVPVCDSCFDRIEAASKQSKLIVPGKSGLAVVH